MSDIQALSAAVYSAISKAYDHECDIEEAADAVLEIIEADRKRHDRMLAHEWIRPALDLPENAPYRFDYYAQEIERLRNDRKCRGEPVAWVAADTLNSPHPACVSSLAYMSQLDRERGREYVPLYAAPVAAQPAANPEPSDEEIDAIAASMPDGAGGMLKQWGYRQFARALLARYGARPAAPQKAEPSDEHVSVVGMPEFDALLDHIYEYGTASEGIIDRANAFARALLSRYGRQQAESAAPAAQAPAADAHPGYAGVTVWVGDMKCTMTVPAPVLGASRCDALLECFQKARHAIDAAMQRISGDKAMKEQA